MKKIFTIGHSNYTEEHFLSLLQTHFINCIVDVRSIPSSRFNPQYNKKHLSEYLKNNKILYIHMPDEFGARHTDPELLDDTGQVDFEKVRDSPAFKSGIERLLKGIDKGYRIALMCAESDPLSCHRFSMIAPKLKNNNLQVLHILKNKLLRSQEQLEEELVNSYKRKFSQGNISEGFVSPAQQLEIAYQWKNREIGFRTS